MITTSDTITLDDSAAFDTGQGRQFRSPNIVSIVRVGDVRSGGRWEIEVQCLDNLDVYMGGSTFVFDTATLSAFGGSGADDVEIFYNCVERAIKDTLETLNPSATFTIV